MASQDLLQQISFGITVLAGLLLWLLEGFFPFFAGRARRGTHTLKNLSMAALNMLILIPGSVLTAFALSVSARFWPGIHLLGLPFALQTLVFILLIDLWMYIWHRLNHQMNFLWRFHAVHHSDPDMDVSTAWRFHFVEIFLSEMIRLPVLMLIGAEIQALLLYTILMTPVIAFHHSNLRLTEQLDALLRKIIPSPNMHRIHHSIFREEHDSNYGSLFSFWDRIFGSFKIKSGISAMKIGLDGEREPEAQALPALLKRPFR
ncbi:fatty acid hydroxylase [Chloroherpeton thalassium ATCC 35110]|uniref:Fatty acid hydroxylase n=1 Tax=Chloroherpeton thalassium (strain ATCC 35110 / GB-78) TaxID=517418 RepID=B3QZ23_CHLT3|nr:sterol desaturase family protein [Chloroherpeton thalassium]ACF13716.1 fatty acid hydroxylase [Chloroherpeton thalassium ATCC 35110]